jgi:pyruvate formate lyase activating enzyme
LLAHTDLVMMDLKHMDEEKHRRATGVSNRRILANARKLAETGILLIFRTPVVPGVNDTPQEIGAIASFIRELGEVWEKAGHSVAARPGLELLPFHRLAGNKYESLGLEYRVRDLQPPTRETIEALVSVASAYGIMVKHR